MEATETITKTSMSADVGFVGAASGNHNPFPDVFSRMFLQIFLVLVVFLSSSYALYEDQIGKFDWRHQYLGKVKLAQFEPRSGVPKVIFVATDQNVIAALSFRTGDIIWRQVMEDPDLIASASGGVNDLITTARNVISLSSGGQYLRAWDKTSGIPRWEKILASKHCSNGQLSLGTNQLVALHCSELTAVSLSDGEEQWSKNLNAPAAGRDVKWSHMAIAGGEEEDTVNVFGGAATASAGGGAGDGTEGDASSSSSSNNGKTAFVSRYGLGGGRLVGLDSVSAPWHAVEKCELITSSTLMCVQPHSGATYSLAMNGGNGKAALKSGPSLTGIQLKIWALGQGYYALSVDGQFSVYKAGQLEPILTLKERPTVATLSGGSSDDLYVATVTPSGRNDVQTIDYWHLPTGGKKRSDWTYKWQLTHQSAPIEKIFSNTFPKPDGNLISRAVIVCQDNLLAMPQSNGWKRHEALAEIVAVDMVDLPLSDAQVDIEKEFGGGGSNNGGVGSSNGEKNSNGIVAQFLQRLRMQSQEIQRSLGQSVDQLLEIGKDPTAMLQKIGLAPKVPGQKSVGVSTTSNLDNGRFERDPFNLHKIIVVATKSGKVYGLDNRRGSVIWELYSPRIRGFLHQHPQQERQQNVDHSIAASEFQSLSLFVARTTAHYPHPAQALVIGQDKESGNGLIVTFDPISGSLVSEHELEFPVTQTMPIPYHTKDNLAAIMLIGPDDKVSVWPSRGIDSVPSPSNIFFMSVNPNTGALRGLTLAKNAQNQWSLNEVWRNKLNLIDGQKLVKIGEKKQSERMHSPGRALGDRSVLYKYSNPNLIAMMALTSGASGSHQAKGGLGSGNGGTLSLFLVDGVSGDVQFGGQHNRALPPLHLVHSENWLVYSFWSEKSRRTELAVMELYEGKSQTDSDAFSSLSPTNSRPLIMRQSYIFQQGITSMAVTDTEKGMTNRHILIAMPFGGILELPKALLDPRRTIIPTMEQREEGLMPYIPELPIATEHIVNYNQTALRIRRIVTRPGGLESTSLVLAHGLDLFYTRLTPSGTFDVLKDDFDHWFISAVLLALFLGSVATKRIARHKELKQNWK